MDPALVAVTAEPDEPALHAAADELAARLKAPRFDSAQAPRAAALLVVTPSGLELRDPSQPRMKGVRADFLSPAMRRRASGGAGRRPLLRAVGFRGQPLEVIDATAGLARDAFVLAAAGCRVTAVERNPVIAAMLDDALRRAAEDPATGSWLPQRLALVEADARELIAALADDRRPDVICIDTMFPPRSKSALAGKEMRICRLVAGSDADAGSLLEVAMRFARRRVVVKRRLHDRGPWPRPQVRFEARSVRYDVYLPQSPCGQTRGSPDHSS